LDGVRGVKGGWAADLGASGVVVAGLGVSNVFGVSKEVGRWIWVGLGVLTGFGASKVGGRRFSPGFGLSKVDGRRIRGPSN
jgi:hypothetical protein